jgi:hypothetical protein
MDWYYAAKSDVPLETACASLGQFLDLPPFAFDTHDNWEYGWADNSRVRLNVTRSEDDQTIQAWMADCPRGVNYQIIVSATSEPPGILDILSRILAVPVHRYAYRP